MTEKRFKMEIPINNGNHPLLKDNETGEIVEIVNVEMLIKKMNEQQATIDKLEQRDYYNQSERYKILCRAIELTANYIDNTKEEHYDFCALVTEFEKELLDDE